MGRQGRHGGWAVFAALLATSSVVRAQAPEAERQAASAAIMKADRDFNQAVADKDRNRFLSLVAETAVFGGGTPGESHGREAVMKGWADFFDKDGPTLTWMPTEAMVSANGDVGSTTGTYVLRSKAPDGTVREQRGAYLTVWRKQADGSWQASFDTGLPFRPAGSGTEPRRSAP